VLLLLLLLLLLSAHRTPSSFEGVKEDARQGCFYMRKAAEQNHVDAALALAQSYYEGAGGSLVVALVSHWLAVRWPFVGRSLKLRIEQESRRT